MLRHAVPAVVALVTWAATAQAQNQQLWLERAENSPPLAKVPNFSQLAARTVPAVVSIHVQQRPASNPGEPSGDPFYDFFRRFGPPSPEPQEGIGSGFMIRGDGLILTNNHVVERAANIEVSVLQPDGSKRKYGAEVLGTAPEWDVALLKTQKRLDAKSVYLGDSDETQIGDWVMAVGNPFGLSHSVSVGIISAKERRDIVPSGRRGLYDFIQTDASINPGNSGGPLINTSGEVIGINTAINAQGSGIGFAIPINMIKAMLPDLKRKGSFERSWIGIRIQPLTPGLAESYGLGEPRGALVAQVVPDSPAAKAGLEAGDIILEFEGEAIQSSNDLQLLASMAGVGSRVSLLVWRNGDRYRVPVVLQAFPEERQYAARPDASQKDELGITVSDISPELKRHFELEQEQGVVIKSVEPGTPAAREGLQPGDIIVSLNGKAVRSAQRFANAIRALESGEAFRLKVSRRGVILYVGLVKP